MFGGPCEDSCGATNCLKVESVGPALAKAVVEIGRQLGAIAICDQDDI
jgi:hypothetical protein